MGEFRKPEIDKKDFVSSKLFDDLLVGIYAQRAYLYSTDHNPHTGDYIISTLHNNFTGVIEEYFYNTVNDRDNDAFQLRLMTWPIFEAC